MQISEIFESIQGEGPWIGYPATFVRLYGCNLNCSFCDSQYSKNGVHAEMTISEVLDRISGKANPYVIFTGGEPCMQFEDMKQVILALRLRCPEKKIAIESNGTIDFDDTIFDVVIISPKSMGVVELWSHRPNVFIKFLAVDENDMENIGRQTRKHIFANIPYVMPIGITADQIITTGKVVTDLIIKLGMDVVFSPRLHILMGVK